MLLGSLAVTALDAFSFEHNARQPESIMFSLANHPATHMDCTIIRTAIPWAGRLNVGGLPQGVVVSPPHQVTTLQVITTMPNKMESCS